MEMKRGIRVKQHLRTYAFVAVFPLTSNVYKIILKYIKKDKKCVLIYP